MFYRYREYQVILFRMTEDLGAEFKGVDVMARSKRDANNKAVLKTPGLWRAVKEWTK